MTAAPRGVARATARERLLAHTSTAAICMINGCPECRAFDAKTRRLLAAVLREAAEAGYYSRTIDQARAVAANSVAERMEGMGMFDSVTVLMELPGNDAGESDFQTKDTDCDLVRYTIGADRLLTLDGKPVLGLRSLNFYTHLTAPEVAARGWSTNADTSGWLEYDATLCPHCGYVASVSKSERSRPLPEAAK